MNSLAFPRIKSCSTWCHSVDDRLDHGPDWRSCKPNSILCICIHHVRCNCGQRICTITAQVHIVNGRKSHPAVGAECCVAEICTLQSIARRHDANWINNFNILTRVVNNWLIFWYRMHFIGLYCLAIFYRLNYHINCILQCPSSSPNPI